MLILNAVGLQIRPSGQIASTCISSACNLFLCWCSKCTRFSCITKTI